MWVDEEAPSFNGVDHSSVDGLDFSAAAEDQKRLLAAAAASGDNGAAVESAMDIGFGTVPGAAADAETGAAKTTAIAGLTAAAAGLLQKFSLLSPVVSKFARLPFNQY